MRRRKGARRQEEGRRRDTVRRRKGMRKQSVIGAMAKKRWLPMTVITIIVRFPNQLPPQTHTALQPHANLPAGLSEIVVEALQLFYLSHKLVTFLELPGDPVAHPQTREEEEKKITNACMHNAIHLHIIPILGMGD